SRGCDMSRSRRSFAMLTLAAIALVFAWVAIHQSTADAQPDPKKPDRKPPPVVAELVGQTEERQAHGPLGIAVAGDYAYLAAWRRGLRVVNIANPKEPQEVGGCRIEGAATDVVVTGGYAYVAAGGGGLRILDLARPASPKEVGSCPVRGGAVAVIVA